jgi:hypothetical protein
MTHDTNDRRDLAERARDEWRAQLLRTRQLLQGSEDEAAEGVLAPLGAQAEVESRIVAALAGEAALAEPERFSVAHRRVMHALDVLDREGARSPSAPDAGAFTPLVHLAVENVAGYIVSNYADAIVDRLHALYGRRLVTCEPGSRERVLLAAARDDVTLVQHEYGGGGILLRLLIGAAAVPALGWIGRAFGLIDIDNGWVWLGLIAALTVTFVAAAWLLMYGAATARRRSRLIMHASLADLWAAIGHGGAPPQDGSRRFATLVIVLTGLVWFIIPVFTALVLLLW